MKFHMSTTGFEQSAKGAVPSVRCLLGTAVFFLAGIISLPFAGQSARADGWFPTATPRPRTPIITPKATPTAAAVAAAVTARPVATDEVTAPAQPAPPISETAPLPVPTRGIPKASFAEEEKSPEATLDPAPAPVEQVSDLDSPASVPGQGEQGSGSVPEPPVQAVATPNDSGPSKESPRVAPPGITPAPSIVTPLPASWNLPSDDPSVEATVFDIYLSDQFTGGILTRYTEDWFEIDDPVDLVSQLTGLTKTDRIEELVQGRISKFRAIEGVGSVRFDPYTFRIIIVLDRSYITARPLDLTETLPDPENKLAFQQQVGIAGATDLQGGGFDTSAMNLISTASRGRYYAIGNGTLLNDNRYQLDTLHGGTVFDTYALEAGYLQTNGLSFGSSLQFLGGQFQTSNDILLARNLLQGSRIELFVPSRSEVFFYRDGRLIGTQILDFGLREIDTTNFPAGSYDVDIVIKEDNGQVTQEKRFFTKTSLLATRSIPIFSMQAGAARDGFDALDFGAYQGSIRWRATGAVEAGASVTGVNDFSISELSLSSYYKDVFGSIFGAASTEGHYGFGVNANTTVSRLSLYGSFFQTLNPLEADQSLPPPEGSSEFERYKYAFNTISRSRTSASAGIGYFFGPLELRYTYARNVNAVPPALAIPGFESILDPDKPEQFKQVSRSRGPMLNWRIYDGRDWSLALNGQYLQTEDGNTSSALLAFRRNLGANFNLASSLRTTRENDGQKAALWQNALVHETHTGGKTAGRIALSSDIDVNDLDDAEPAWTNGLQAERITSYFAGSGFVRNVSSREGSDSTAGVGAQASVLVGQDSGIAISPPVTGNSGVLIAEVESKKREGQFDVLINDQVVDVVAAGSRKAISLAPYKRYTVKVRPSEGSELMDFEGPQYDLAVFPGNILKRSWKAARIMIAVGRVVDGNGEPVRFQRVKGPRDYVVTEEDGSFQAEITGDEQLYIKSKQQDCSLKFVLPEAAEDLYFVDLGELVCQARAGEAAEARAS